MKKLLFLVCVSLVFLSCERTSIGDCFKSTGKQVIQPRDVGYFNKIRMEDNVNLILTQDMENRVVVEAGENIIDKVITEVENNELVLKNNNSCNWTRSYNKEIDIYVSVSELESIYYLSSGDIISTNAIVSDSLNVAVWDGSGSIHLELNTKQSVLSLHYGTVDFNVTGRSKINFIFAASYGPFYCENLETTFTFMNNRGSNDCYVNCTQQLEVEIEYVGNIYYTGDPDIIKANITGTGELIKLN